MSYDIKRTDGTSYYGTNGLEENTTDTIVYTNGSTGQGIVMIGKLIPEYGTDQSNNFLRLLENFANDATPDKPVLGMLWYKKSENSLNICTDERNKLWTKILTIKSSKLDNPQPGDIYYDRDEKAFYIYDEVDKWVLIGPINYKHKIQQSFECSTYSGSTQDSVKIISDKLSLENTSYLVTAKIVAREIFSRQYAETNSQGRVPETAAWIYTLLVENYLVTSNDTQQTAIIGNPNHQIIAMTNGSATTWGVTPSINSNGELELGVYGTGTNDRNVTESENHIQWEIEVEVLKV